MFNKRCRHCGCEDTEFYVLVYINNTEHLAQKCNVCKKKWYLHQDIYTKRFMKTCKKVKSKKLLLKEKIKKKEKTQPSLF